MAQCEKVRADPSGVWASSNLKCSEIVNSLPYESLYHVKISPVSKKGRRLALISKIETAKMAQSILPEDFRLRTADANHCRPESVTSQRLQTLCSFPMRFLQYFTCKSVITNPMFVPNTISAVFPM